MKTNEKERSKIYNTVINTNIEFREFIAKEAEFIIKNMLNDKQYQGLIEGIGRLYYLAELCKEDSYWYEKTHNGFYKQQLLINELLSGKEADYIGYLGYIQRDESLYYNGEFKKGYK